MTNFDYELMYDFSDGSTVFVGSRIKYHTLSEFIQKLTEKEELGDAYIAELGRCRYGFYSDENGDLCNGWHYSDHVEGRGSIPVYIVKEARSND